MLDRVVEMREDILKQLKEDGKKFGDKIVDMMVDEFGERIDNYEMSQDKELTRDSKTYKKLMLQAIKNVTKRVGKINFTVAQRDIIEDDYSEESNADFKFRR